jgi:hypothetical protein
MMFGQAAMVNAQQVANCGDSRPTSLETPWAGQGDLWCVEHVSAAPSLGAVGYTQLAVVGDALYAIVPERGELVRFTDSDNDALPDAPETVLDGLIYPTALAADGDSLYLASRTPADLTRARITRYIPADEASTVLLDDLPSGWTGYPLGGLAVQADGLYISVGGDAACSDGRGTIYRYGLADATLETIATGVYMPSRVVAYAGDLWFADAHTDTLWALRPNTDYGACAGTPPAGIAHYRFRAGSAPLDLSAYQDGALEPLSGALLVALRGTSGQIIVEGYEVVALHSNGALWEETGVLPVVPPQLNLTEQKMHLQRSGFYPRHVYGVTVNARGWVYISAGDGQIIALRPIAAFAL